MTVSEPSAPTRAPRRVCSGCGRPETVCLCASIVRTKTATRVVILQHPREADVPIGTAQLVELCLGGVERHVGVEFAQSPRLKELLADRASPPILLYPGPGARDLERDPPSGPATLVVIDGTWWQSQKILKRNPELSALPRYGLAPSAPSRYRIRREPEAHCVSTIEAIGYALVALGESPSLLTTLFAPFDAMVEHQLRFAHETHARRHLMRPRRPRGPPAPQALRDRAEDLVLAYGETNAWPRGTPLGQGSEVVHLVAERVAGGERFEAFIAPRRPLSPSFEHHTGLSPERVLEGESFESFRARWAAFLRPSDLLAGWGVFWSEALRMEGAALPERVDVRLVARRTLGKRPGDVEACAERLGERPPEPFARGRTGRRLAALAAVVRGLQRMTEGE